MNVYDPKPSDLVMSRLKKRLNFLEDIPKISSQNEIVEIVKMIKVSALQMQRKSFLFSDEGPGNNLADSCA